MIKYEEFMAFYQILCSRFNRVFDKKSAELDYCILKDEFANIEEFKQAIYRLFKERVYPTIPTPAEIIKHKHINDETLNLLAIKEWNKVINNLNHTVKQVFYDNKITQQAVNELGYIMLCKSTVEELQFIMKRFIELFKALYKLNKNEYPVIKGEFENSYHLFVGNKDKALELCKEYKKNYLTENDCKRILNKINSEKLKLAYNASDDNGWCNNTRS